ncbi:hypothetical protein LD85_3061 [Saccharolobus islandicus L.D.8.5]|uniref:Uncharacterized protein n=1 Tax=Saccharolobus islandicus (strain L.D.8.5 / Lassen \|nr:hypothetical protein LD85_3061 [Sulfolobus islandicus L.D.8.5]
MLINIIYCFIKVTNPLQYIMRQIRLAKIFKSEENKSTVR